MASLVEIYKGLGKVRKLQPFQANDIAKSIFEAYIDNTISHWEKVEKRANRKFPLSVIPGELSWSRHNSFVG